PSDRSASTYCLHRASTLGPRYNGRFTFGQKVSGGGVLRRVLCHFVRLNLLENLYAPSSLQCLHPCPPLVPVPASLSSSLLLQTLNPGCQ
ncbi:MAG: hypothetical protein ACK56I_17900, partial [bacterium]